MAMTDEPGVWTESDSRDFIDLADIAVPGRDEQMKMLLSLVPATAGETFEAAELACGEGIFARRLLERFPHARLTAFDGSDVMLERARERLSAFPGRSRLLPFRLEEEGWLADLAPGLRYVVSSLALHHLADEAKRRLYAALASRLEPGGALMIADVVAPANQVVRLAFAH